MKQQKITFYNKRKKFSLKVEVYKNWLQNADYPVEVDPTITLDSTSGIYGGYIE